MAPPTNEDVSVAQIGEEWARCWERTCWLEPRSQEALVRHIPGLRPLVGDVDGTVRPSGEGDWLLVRRGGGEPFQSYAIQDGAREAQPLKGDWLVVDGADGMVRPLGQDPFSYRASPQLSGAKVVYGEIPVYRADEAPRPYGAGALFVHDVVTWETERISRFDDSETHPLSLVGDNLLVEVKRGNDALEPGYYVYDLDEGRLRFVSPQHNLGGPLERWSDYWVWEAGLTNSGIGFFASGRTGDFVLLHLDLEAWEASEIRSYGGLPRDRHVSLQAEGDFLLYSESRRFRTDGSAPEDMGSGWLYHVNSSEVHHLENVAFGLRNGRTPGAPVMQDGGTLYAASNGPDSRTIWYASDDSEPVPLFIDSRRDRVDALGLSPDSALLVINRTLYEVEL